MNRFTQWIALAVAALTLTGGTFLAQQSSPSVKEESALRAAIERETVRGDVAGAIEEYKKLGNSKDHAVAVKALLRLAEVYGRRGESEARKVYEQIVAKFPDQKDAVATAQSRLGSGSGTVGVGKETRRRICVGPGCEFGWASPDGRFIALPGARIWNLSTGETRDTVEAERSRLLAEDFGTRTPIFWSPDSERVAYSIDRPTPEDSVKEHAIRNGGDRAAILQLNRDKLAQKETYVIGASGGGGLIHRGGNVLAWSSDGNDLFINAALPNEPGRLLWLTVANGKTRPIPTMIGNITAARVSPDNRYIAVYGTGAGALALRNGNPSGSSIYVIATDGSGEFPVADFGASIRRLVGWMPDGKRLLFAEHASGSRGSTADTYSSSSGENNLWTVTVSQGKAQGPPVQVNSSEWGSGTAEVRGVSREGTLRYAPQRKGGSVIYTASFDSRNGTITSMMGVLPVGWPTPSQAVPMRWSPDGKRLLYARVQGGTQAFSIYSFDGRNEQRVAAEITAQRGPFCWSADGSAIVFTKASGPNQPGEIVRLNLNTNIVAPLLPAGTNFTLSSCAGDLISDDSPNVSVRNLRTGSEVHMRTAAAGQPAPTSQSYLSHNGRFVAFVAEVGPDPVGQVALSAAPAVPKVYALFVASLDGGPLRELARGPFPRNGLAWSHDDRYVYFAGRSTISAPGFAPNELFRVPTAGGAKQSTGLSVAGQLTHIEISPDGKRIAFNTQPQPELWATDDYLPVTK